MKKSGPEGCGSTLQGTHGYHCSFVPAAHPDFNRLHLPLGRQ